MNWLISPSASAQAVAHHIEGARQFVEFLAAAHDVERLVEFHLAHRLGAFDQLVDRPAEESAREVDDEQADQRDFDRRHDQDAELHGGHFVVYAFQVQPEVQHAEHLHFGGMSVALRLAARGFVVDRRGHGQPAAAVGSAEDAHARGQVAGPGFGRCLGSTGLVLRIGGEHHLSGAIEHAYAVDPLFERDGLHHLIGGLAMVVQHGVPCRAGDGFGELIGTEENGVQELLFFG